MAKSVLVACLLAAAPALAWCAPAIEYPRATGAGYCGGGDRIVCRGKRARPPTASAADTQSARRSPNACSISLPRFSASKKSSALTRAASATPSTAKRVRIVCSAPRPSRE